MKNLYDSQIFWMQKFGGISRYFYQLCKYSGSKYDYHISGVYSENNYALELSQMKPFPIQEYFKGKGRIIHFLNKHNDKKQLNRSEYDIFHPTYYFDFKKIIVLTADDFIQSYNQKLWIA